MSRKQSRRSAARRAVASRPAPEPVNHAPANTTQGPPPAPVQPSSGGSILGLGGIGGVIADGMAFGTGSAIAHRAVDAVMGPRVVQHEHTAASTAAAAPMASSAASVMPDSCTLQAKTFQDCITTNGNDIGKCQFYLDMLNECKKGSTVGGKSEVGNIL